MTIHDGSHNPMANVLVEGNWSGGSSGSASCTTNGSGICSVQTGGIRNRFSSVTFAVTTINGAAPDTADTDPEGDSAGGSITVNKPAITAANR